MSNRPLRVFLCHGSNDSDSMRRLYDRLNTDGMDSWLDEVKLLPGQDWKSEIPKAMGESDVIIISLSKKTITKEGYLQNEIKQALDAAKEKPEGTIYLIPAKLEKCAAPKCLDHKKCVNLYDEKGYEQLISALHARAKTLRRRLPTGISGTAPFITSPTIKTDKSLLKKSANVEKANKIAAAKGTILEPLLDFSSLQPVPFVNRIDEIDAITATASAGGQYFLVDAPAGYGKTYLLHQLNERFKAKGNWDHDGQPAGFQ